MILTDTQQMAELHLTEARHLRENGEKEEAAAKYRQAVLLLASIALDPELHTRAIQFRAETCREFADCLMEGEQFPEAANIYQEATDLFTLLDSEQAEQQARLCAHRALLAIQSLNARPQDRLHLLIARYERIQRQRALEPGTEAQQAECAAHIALIFLRRERFPESALRYEEAIHLYQQGEQTPETQLALAECHHRLGTLYAVRLNRLPEAARQFHQAIALYAETDAESALALCRIELARIEPLSGVRAHRHSREDEE